MSSGDLRQDASEYNQDSSDSDVESQNSSCIQGKPKRVDKASACRKFRDIIQADFPGSSFGERKQRLIEHFRTRTSSERPLSVRSVTVFADLDQIAPMYADCVQHLYTLTASSRMLALPSNAGKGLCWHIYIYI